MTSPSCVTMLPTIKSPLSLMYEFIHPHVNTNTATHIHRHRHTYLQDKSYIHESINISSITRSIFVIIHSTVNVLTSTQACQHMTHHRLYTSFIKHYSLMGNNKVIELCTHYLMTNNNFIPLQPRPHPPTLYSLLINNMH